MIRFEQCWTVVRLVPGAHHRIVGAFLIALAAATLVGCQKQEVSASNGDPAPAANAGVTVGVTKVSPRNLAQQLKISSELVPFQEIDVYAKESGYIKELYVDYGSRVKKGELMAVLEIPELEAQIQQDEAAVRNATDMVTHAAHELDRVEKMHVPLHAEYERLNGVAVSRPGLVAQQEVDDAQGKDLAAEAQVEASKAGLQSAQSQLQAAEAKKEHDSVLYAYSKITAPFAGVVTQRYANYGALMQAGTSSSTQAMPLVRLAQEDLYRLAIPVPESAVRFIRIGQMVAVRVPSLNRDFEGKVARFSVDVHEDTRTMHTEVDVPNPDRVLIPGAYAEATITLGYKENTLSVPLQALSQTPVGWVAYVVNGSNQIEDREIKIGMQTDLYAEVTSGLQEGEMVVVSDTSSLRKGQQVHPKIVEVLNYTSQKE